VGEEGRAQRANDGAVSGSELEGHGGRREG
jgi:hypothetical protein